MILSHRFHKIVKVALATLAPLFFNIFSYASEEFSVKKSIISYNMMVAEAAKAPDFLKSFSDKKRLEEYADKKVAQKLFIWIKSWHENGLYMDAKLNDISFGNIIFSGKDSASVVTDETWHYSYFRRLEGEIKKEAIPKRKKEYKVKYWLKKLSSRWKIVKIELLKDVEKDLYPTLIL